MQQRLYTVDNLCPFRGFPTADAGQDPLAMRLWDKEGTVWSILTLQALTDLGTEEHREQVPSHINHIQTLCSEYWFYGKLNLKHLSFGIKFLF